MPSKPDLHFEFGGRLSLDLTWTLRFRAVAPTDLLDSPADLRAWFRTVGLPAPATLARDGLDKTRALREAIYGAASAVVDERPIDAGDLTVINHSSAHPPPAPQLSSDGTSKVVVPHGSELECTLSVIARDAIHLLSTTDGRLRRCAGPLCSLLFHDASRPGRRRWCATSRCGNKVHTKAYRQRQRYPSRTR